MGKLFDEEGESVSNVETVLKQYGITLRDTTGEFRNTGDVLDELAVKWKDLSNAQKSEIAEQLAGVRQKDRVLTLLENYNKALDLQEVSLNSAGSALEKFNIYQESTEAKLTELRNEFEIFATKTIDSKVIKSIIEFGGVLLKFANTDIGQAIIQISLMTTAVVMLTKAFGILKATAIVDLLGGIAGAIPLLVNGTASLNGVLTVLGINLTTLTSLLGVGAIVGFAYAIKNATNFVENQSKKVSDLSATISELSSEYESLSGRQDLSASETARLSILEDEISLKKEILKQESEYQYQLMNRPKVGLAKDSATDIQLVINAYKNLSSQVTTTAQAETKRQDGLLKLRTEMSQHSNELKKLRDAGVQLTQQDLKLISTLDDLSQGLDKQTASTLDADTTTRNLNKVIADYTSSVDYLTGVENQLATATGLSREEKDKLLQKYPQLEKAVYNMANGYGVEKGALEAVRNSLIGASIDQVNSEKARTETARINTLARIKMIQAEQQALRGSAEAIQKAQPALKGSFADKPYLGASQTVQKSIDKQLAKKEAEAKKLQAQIDATDKAIASAMSQVGGVSAGGKVASKSGTSTAGTSSGVGGKSGGAGSSSQTDKIKEEFEKQYKVLQHQLTMNKISETQYLNKLEILYKKYFANKKKYLDEYNQYEEEVYTKRKAIEEKQLKERLEKEKEVIEKRKEALNSLTDLVVDLIKFEKQQEKDYYTDLINQEKERHNEVVENLKDEVDAKKEALEDELDAYRKIIEAQLESIRLRESERDHQNELSDKQKELAKLEAELREVSFDDSAEGRAKRLALEEQIANQKKEIDEFQHDREVELTEDALNKELEKYEESIKNQLDQYDDYLKEEESRYKDSLNNRIKEYEGYVKDIDNYLKKEGLLRSEANRRIESEGQSLYQKLTDYNAEYGSLSQEALSTMWNTAGEAMTAYEQKQLSVLDTLKILSREMNRVTTALGGEAVDVDGSGKKSSQQLNQQKYLHDLMIKAKAENNTGLINWIKSERKKWGLDQNTGAVIEKFHTGIQEGFVGGKTGTKSNEQLALLMKGEGVFTEKQMESFMKITLPTMLGMAGTSQNNNGISINMPMTFEGNVDEAVLPDLKNFVKKTVDTAIGQLNNAMKQRGQTRNAKTMSI